MALSPTEQETLIRGGADLVPRTRIEIYLLLFTTEGIRHKPQKKALKQEGLIEYGSNSWHLSEKGKAEAVRLGFLS